MGPINNIGSVSAHNKQLNNVFNNEGILFKKKKLFLIVSFSKMINDLFFLKVS